MNSNNYVPPRQRLHVVGCAQHLPQNINYMLRVEASCFNTASEFLRSIPEMSAGCLLVSSELPDGTGLGLHREVSSRALDLTSVLVLEKEDVRLCREAFQSGVANWIMKGASDDEWLAVIQSAIQRNNAEVPGRRKRRTRRMRIDNLTSREMDVAKLLSNGRALKEVGAQLQISVQTASKHRTNIFSKMDVSNQVELHQAFEDCLDLLEQAKS
ncbi:MAG: LuxR C-terminal-related transcriptional regulator [Planctomycetota bacterium]